MSNDVSLTVTVALADCPINEPLVTCTVAPSIGADDESRTSPDIVKMRLSGELGLEQADSAIATAARTSQ